MLLDGQTTNSKCRYRSLYKVMTFLSISFQKQVFFYLSYILFRCLHLLKQCWLTGMTEVALPLPGRNGYFSIKMTEVGWGERILLHQVWGWLVVAKRQSYWDNVLLSLVNKEYLVGMNIEIVKYLFNWDNPRIFLFKSAGTMLDENIALCMSSLTVLLHNQEFHGATLFFYMLMDSTCWTVFLVVLHLYP